ncbi:MAG: hypothetical protein MRY83_09225 [Flavobacteriales bacterium]|nr:hypothetical protein [Flavobacteriales bacterium]
MKSLRTYWVLIFCSCNMSYVMNHHIISQEDFTDFIIEYEKNTKMKQYPYYQGTDSSHHHFIVRYMDSWKWFDIRKDQIQLKDQRPYCKTSSCGLGYYRVDPLNNYRVLSD